MYMSATANKTVKKYVCFGHVSCFLEYYFLTICVWLTLQSSNIFDSWYSTIKLITWNNELNECFPSKRFTTLTLKNISLWRKIKRTERFTIVFYLFISCYAKMRLRKYSATATLLSQNLKLSGFHEKKIFWF